VRCGRFGGSGQLGYGNTRDPGDDETPASVGAVSIFWGRQNPSAACTIGSRIQAGR
jgi:hypothetical protein